jgi:tellurium resistance protein TerD
MPIKMNKGDGVNLSKDHGLRRVIAELTFDVDPTHPVKKHEMDVGIMAFELTHASGKPLAPQDGSFVFYNNLSSPNGATTHEKDGGSIGDDILHIDFDLLDASPQGIDEVSVIAEIYEGLKRGHNFGQFSHCTVHIVNPDTKEVIAEFRLTDDDSTATAVQLGSFVKKDGHWIFIAVGVGYQKGIADFLAVYGLQAADEE